MRLPCVTMSIIGKALFDADVFSETDELGAAMAVTMEYVSHALSVLFPVPYDGQRRAIVARTKLHGYCAIAFNSSSMNGAIRQQNGTIFFPFCCKPGMKKGSR